MPALPRLYFDIDGVLAFQPEGSILAVNARYNAAHLVAEAVTYPWAASLPTQQQDWLTANLPVICANLAPDTLAVKVVRKAVKAGFPVTVATERDPSLEGITRAWLTYWGVPCEDLAVTGPGGKGPLIAARQEKNAILIDDDPGKAGLVSPGVEVWQPARPYNQSADGVWRFDDWRQVKKKLGL